MYKKLNASNIESTYFKGFKKGEEPDDVLYWLSRLPIERIITLEEIRKQYNDWKYSSGREFRSVYKVVKRKRS